ncbi:MAG: DUF3604 domain-containing protein [Marmoricola sp.]
MRESSRSFAEQLPADLRGALQVTAHALWACMQRDSQALRVMLRDLDEFPDLHAVRAAALDLRSMQAHSEIPAGDPPRPLTLDGRRVSHHNHQHPHVCGGPDHHRESYTPQQRADLETVLAFNARFAAAIDELRDTRDTERFLDPDPLRYMWVDEGQGRIPEIIATAEKLLADAPALPGHRRQPMTPAPSLRRACRPSLATGADGSALCCWTEWEPGEGDVLRAALAAPGTALPDARAETLDDGVTDIHRPTAALAADGSAWVFFGRPTGGGVHRGGQAEEVAVHAVHRVDGAWGAVERVSTGEPPAFNQEAAAHADGRVELCWQGRDGGRFGIWSRTWHPGAGWDATTLVSAGVDANVWDPAVVPLAGGGTAYAWSAYAQGTYRVQLCIRNRDGSWGDPRTLTSGSDYALHPSLAVTDDGSLWCAYDVITVAGHGGSGPTRLRPAASLGDDPSAIEGSRSAGASVPSDLLPDVEARVEVVRVDESTLWRPRGELGEALDVVPAGLPKLCAVPGGGLSVTYRIHRRLPLMTFYWEVATQVLGADGWGAPTTYAGSDGTLEEVAVAPAADGLVVAAQCDDRLGRALQWTEGFGGRECLYLADHQGEVIWHGVHDVGAVAVANLAATGSPARDAAAAAHAVAESSGRHGEARRWVGATRHRRQVEAGGRTYRLYWGDLHRHSLISRCTAGDEPNLEDFYRYAWDVCEYDFWAVTDHSENSSDYQWWTIQKIADLLHIPGRFVPFYGFEWTSPDTGHQNVIYGDVRRGAPIFSAFAEGSTTPAGLWQGLAAHPDFPAITIPHHPGSAMVHNDWDYHHPEYSRLVEVFQACRGNYEGLGAFRQYSDATATGTFVVDGLKRGHRFGLIASSDHGFGASYVGAYAESLDRASVFEALHSRRTFAATTRDVVVDLRLGPAFMGEEVAWDGPRELVVHAHGYTDLARIDVVRNGVTVHSVLPDLDLPSGWLAVPLRLEWGGADRATSWDGDLAVAGGRVLRTPFWSPEVVAADEATVAWRSSTRSFGAPYGAQRGGIECTVLGPPDARATIRAGDRSGSLAVAELAALDGPRPFPGEPGHFAVQPGTGGLSSLGTTGIDLTWTDQEADGPAFYYVRAVQVDGEMAWSSPIWVTPG